MGSFFISLLFAVGAATWVYTKLQQKTGYGNSQSALIGAAVTGVGLFLVMFMTTKLVGL
ncbi:MAG: hypothetical protein WBO35_06275 [Candidatus Saccharimonadales bacterium]|jgi:hypothetical protein